MENLHRMAGSSGLHYCDIHSRPWTRLAGTDRIDIKFGTEKVRRVLDPCLAGCEWSSGDYLDHGA